MCRSAAPKTSSGHQAVEEFLKRLDLRSPVCPVSQEFAFPTQLWPELCQSSVFQNQETQTCHSNYSRCSSKSAGVSTNHTQLWSFPRISRNALMTSKNSRSNRGPQSRLASFCKSAARESNREKRLSSAPFALTSEMNEWTST